MSDTRERAAKLAHVLWTHEGNGSGPEIWKAAATVLLLEFAQSLEAEVAANSYGAALTERYGEFEADRVCLINVTTSIKSLHGVCIIEPDKEFQGCKICWTRREAEGQIRKLNALLKLQPPRVEETDLQRTERWHAHACGEDGCTYSDASECLAQEFAKVRSESASRVPPATIGPINEAKVQRIPEWADGPSVTTCAPSETLSEEPEPRERPKDICRCGHLEDNHWGHPHSPLGWTNCERSDCKCLIFERAVCGPKREERT